MKRYVVAALAAAVWFPGGAPTSAQAPPTGSVRPIVECVVAPASPDEPYVARFGYLNEFADPQVIPLGPDNRLVPALPASLPTTFLVGRQVAVFEVEFSGAPLVWTLTDPAGRTRTATASSSTRACPPPCAPVPPDVLGWWRGEDDLAAEVGPDLAGRSAFTPGRAGRGFQFDAPAPLADLPGLLTVDGFPVVRDEVSVEVWIKPVVTGSTQMIVSQWTERGGIRDDSFALAISPIGELVWMTDGPSARWPTRVRVPAPQLFDGGWHHVAGTWTAQQTVVYLDGAAVLAKASREGRLNEVSTQFRIGSSSGRGVPFPFAGVLDEPTVYGRALTGAEVSSIFASRETGKCIDA
jgi:hypothetical protein